MLIYIREQTENLDMHLRWFLSISVEPYRIEQLKKKENTIQIPCNRELNKLSFKFLFSYNVFPDNILTAYTQWQHEERTMRVGDTIAQQIYFPPIKRLSQKIIVGVRIKEIFEKDNLLGFSYETLHGHIEKGISSFLVERKSEYINIIVRTHSKANSQIMDLLSPLFSSPYQDYCTAKALQHMKDLFKKENSIP